MDSKDCEFCPAYSSRSKLVSKTCQREYGFCFVDGCPVSPQKTQELLERIAFIRITHYGGFFSRLKNVEAIFLHPQADSTTLRQTLQ